MEQGKFFPEINGNFGFGCMRLPMKGGKVDYETFIKMADSFVNAGFNYFDNLVEVYADIEKIHQVVVGVLVNGCLGFKAL